MERISEAGALYLNDYQILTEARKEVERFLNSIVEEVYNIILNEKEKLDTNNFRISLWNNQSSKGHMRVEFISLKDDNIFRKDKADLHIIYKDIRNVDRIQPTSAQIVVWSPNVSSKLENDLRALSVEKLGEDIYNPLVVEFDLNNSISTAEKIAREIFSKGDLINQLIKEIQ